jgi:ABC-type nitrate/sulfonate/bicarbonate transport system substrate-binding protein
MPESVATAVASCVGRARAAIPAIVRAELLPLVKGHTIRTIIANKDSLEAKRAIYTRFMRAYRETIDWMYANNEALKIYAAFAGISIEDAQRIRDEFDPKEMVIPDRVVGLSDLMPDAIKFKFISQPLTEAQLKELVELAKFERTGACAGRQKIALNGVVWRRCWRLLRGRSWGRPASRLRR